METRSVFSTGGTVQASGGIYIRRQADDDLLTMCREGRLVYILNTRQVGKSSLMINTSRQLIDEGFRTAVVDLTALGVKGVDVDQWYRGLLIEIVSQIDVEVDVPSWWDANHQLGVTQRLTTFFEQVVLKESSDRVLVFIDEIDSTISLPFTDDFFSAIRFLFNHRARQPDLNRLSFVLIGTASPNELVANPTRSPFNVGEPVNLTDFTLEEMAPLASGFDLPLEQATEVLKQVRDWTNGHPYLTQRLCRTIAKESAAIRPIENIDVVVDRTFFGEKGSQDSNINFVRNRLTDEENLSISYRIALLRLYQHVLDLQKKVPDDRSSDLKEYLKLTGVARPHSGELVVRNRIYEEVFDSQWVTEVMPTNQTRRLVIGLAIAAVLLAVALVIALLRSPEPTPEVDLIVQAVDVFPARPVPGEQAIIKVQVGNSAASEAAVGPFLLDFREDENAAAPDFVIEIAELAPGETTTVEIPHIFSWWGPIRSKVRVDANNAIQETEEFKNEFLLSVTTSTAPFTVDFSRLPNGAPVEASMPIDDTTFRKWGFKIYAFALDPPDCADVVPWIFVDGDTHFLGTGLAQNPDVCNSELLRFTFDPIPIGRTSVEFNPDSTNGSDSPFILAGLDRDYSVLGYEPAETVNASNLLGIQNPDVDDPLPFEIAHLLFFPQDGAVTQVTSLTFDQPIVLETMGDSYLAQGDYDAALSAFERADELDPGNGEIVFKIGQTCALLGDYRTAMSAFSEALESGVDPVKVRIRRGTVLLELNEAATALDDFNAALAAIEPAAVDYSVADHVDALIGQARAYVQLDNMDAALEILFEAADLDEKDAEVPYYQGLVYEHFGILGSAETNFSEAIEKDPEYAEAYYHRGRVRQQREQNGKALEDFHKALELDPLFGEAYYATGVSLAALERPVEAAEAFNCARHSFRLSNQSDEATDSFELSKLYDPRWAIVPRGCAAIHRALGTTQEGSEEYLQAGIIAFEDENFEQALVEFEDALDLFPDSRDALLFRGIVFNDLEEYAKALDDFNAYIELTTETALETDRAIGFLNRGLVHVALEDYEAAQADFDLALEFETVLVEEVEKNRKSVIALLKGGTDTDVTFTQMVYWISFQVVDEPLNVRTSPTVSPETLIAGRIFRTGQIVRVLAHSRTEKDGLVWWQHNDGWSAECSLDSSQVYMVRETSGVRASNLFDKFPVALEQVQWIQYFGNTTFAFEHGAENGFDNYAQGMHGGVDFGAPGSVVRAGIRTELGGVVVYAGGERAFKPIRVDVQVGNYVVIYGHLESAAVQEGDRITSDTIIGTNGSEPAQIHLEIRSGSKILNPLLFFENDLIDALIRKFNPRGQFQPFDAKWQTPLDQPDISIGGPVIGPRSTASDTVADRGPLPPAQIYIKPAVHLWLLGSDDRTFSKALTKVLLLQGRAELQEPEQNPDITKTETLTTTISYTEYATEARDYTLINCLDGHDCVQNWITGLPPVDGAVLVIAPASEPELEADEQMRWLSQLPTVVVFLDGVDVSDGQLAELLASYGLPSDTPVVGGSIEQVLDSQGYDIETPEYQPVLELVSAIEAHIMIPERDFDPPFLMPVEDVRGSQGRGTVVIGRVEQGSLKPSDDIEIIGLTDETVTAEVTEIKGFSEIPDEAHSGDNAEVSLDSVDGATLQRGMVLAKPGSISAHIGFVSALFLLDDTDEVAIQPITNGDHPQFFIRTADVTGAITLPDGVEAIMPGDIVKTSVELSEPIALAIGDRFTIRVNGTTIGQGIVTGFLD